MALRIKTTLLVLLLLIYISSGIVEGFSDGTKPIYSLHKDGVQVKSRKILGLDSMLDYDYAGANPKHGKKPPGGGNGKNP